MSPRRGMLTAYAIAALLLVGVALLAAPQSADAIATSQQHARPSGHVNAPRGRDDEEDDDEDDDDPDDWDFMSDDALLRLAQQHAKQQSCVDTLPPERINDEYCDCADGSDESATAACAHVLPPTSFQCRSSDERIAAAMVQDRVCDCCDGSDEAPSVHCPNTCIARRLERIHKLQQRLEIVTRGLERRPEYAAESGPRLQALQVEFQQVAERMQLLDRALQQRQQELKASGQQPSDAAMQELRTIYGELQYRQYVAFVLHNVVDPVTFDAAQQREAYAALVGQCFPFTVNEKQLKGGSSNVVPREYVMVFCPFQNVTQTEPGYSQWQRAERQAKIGGLMQQGINSKEEASEQRPIRLGLWGAWTSSQNKPTDAGGIPTAPLVHQHFEHGEPCANGKEREVRAEIECGDVDRVLSVEENEMCVYSLRFATPVACSIAEQQQLQTALDALLLADASSSSSATHDEL